MSRPPPPPIRRSSSRVYDIHDPSDLNELARKLSRRRSRRSTGGSAYTPSGEQAQSQSQSQYGFPNTRQHVLDGEYVAEPTDYSRDEDAGDAAGNVALATPLGGVPTQQQAYERGYDGTGEELGHTMSRRSRASQRPRDGSVREEEEDEGEEVDESDDEDDDRE
jgi:hypothetical protein